MAVKIINGSDVSWGIEGFQTFCTTCLTGTITDTARTEPIPNETGGDRGEVIYEIDHALSMEVLVDKSATMPNIGDFITADGIGFVVHGLTKKAANNDFKKWEITGDVTQTMIDANVGQPSKTAKVEKPKTEPPGTQSGDGTGSTEVA